MNLLIFGTGRFFENRKKYLIGHSIIGFIDNDYRKWGMTLDGEVIHNPKQGVLLEYDKVLLMSINSGEMKRQLLEQLGISNTKVMLWEEFQALMDKGHLELYSTSVARHFNKKEKVLIIVQDLDYSGGPLTAVYAAVALCSRGYEVCLAAPGGKVDFIHEVNDLGINVILYRNLCYASLDELKWIEPFHFVIVNTLLMRHCAILIKKEKPLFWWIHEMNELYETLNHIDPYVYNCDVHNIKIFAVSDIARKNFMRFFLCNHIDILPYGIPDRKSVKDRNKDDSRLVIAIIGPVVESKGQDILLNAIKHLDRDLCLQADFWIIGDLCEGNPFADNILKESVEIFNIALKGRMTRREIEQIFDEIDVVVCASREETMSMAITEGMMYGKICITSDATGIADFIQNGENGFVFESENYIDLSQKLNEIIKHKKDLGCIGENARKTYLENFSMDKFGDRLEQILGELKNNESRWQYGNMIFQ